MGTSSVKCSWPIVGESGTMLSFGGQVGIGGEIKQPGPALAEGAGNLRDAQFLEREWAAERFVETNGLFDLAAELFEGIGRTRRRRGDLHHASRLLRPSAPKAGRAEGASGAFAASRRLSRACSSWRLAKTSTV